MGGGPATGRVHQPRTDMGCWGCGSPGTGLERRGVRGLESGKEDEFKAASFWLNLVSRGIGVFFVFCFFAYKETEYFQSPPQT